MSAWGLQTAARAILAQRIENNSKATLSAPRLHCSRVSLLNCQCQVSSLHALKQFWIPTHLYPQSNDNRILLSYHASTRTSVRVKDRLTRP